MAHRVVCMNISSFIGYCCGVPYVIKEKLDQAMADDRNIQTQNADETEFSQRQQQRTQANSGGGSMVGRFGQSGAATVPLTANTPTRTDVLTRMLDNATQPPEEAGLMTQLRQALANPAAMGKNLQQLGAQIASLFFGQRKLQETDQAAKDKRQKADEEAQREDPGLMMLDVSTAGGVGEFGPNR
jgi:hypothetical protein